MAYNTNRKQLVVLDVFLKLIISRTLFCEILSNAFMSIGI
jgi:hypothetical protein